jgi:hypothetical protein
VIAFSACCSWHSGHGSVAVVSVVTLLLSLLFGTLEGELADVLFFSRLQASCKAQTPETLAAPTVACRQLLTFSRHEPAQEPRDRVLENRP